MTGLVLGGCRRVWLEPVERLSHVDAGNLLNDRLDLAHDTHNLAGEAGCANVLAAGRDERDVARLRQWLGNLSMHAGKNKQTNQG